MKIGKILAGSITAEEAAEQVMLITKRLAMLYHYTAEVLSDRFGEEKATELLKEIISRYGSEVGENTREKVKAQGLPLTVENFNAGSDLPRWGWEGDRVQCEDNVERARITRCPLAEVWKEKGSVSLGRIYCLVDQAKYKAYNGSSCHHLKNILDGDQYCLFDLAEKELNSNSEKGS